MRSLRIVALALSLILTVGVGLSFQLPDIYERKGKPKKKKKADEEPRTQVLELPPDPPGAVAVETNRLAFHVSPLSNKGLLSQQVRDALKALVRLTHGNQIVALRAFVAGTGDLRRVQQIVSETFLERKATLPTLSVIQVGALPMEGSQVVIESVSLDRKVLNPEGLAFLSGQQVVADPPTLDMKPLIEKSVAQINTGLTAAAATPSDVLRVTCYVSSLFDQPKAQLVVSQAFPQAATHFVQTQRAPTRSLVECEAIASLTKPVGVPVKLLNPEGLLKSEMYSQVALIAAPRIAFSGTQMAFAYGEEDARLAFQRLQKSLEMVKTTLRSTVMTRFYPLTGKSTDVIRKVRFDYLDKAHPPASTLLSFEGLPSLDASFGFDVIAVVP
ncbi:MAG: RidA family protein [Bryobacteraceae bacterium]